MYELNWTENDIEDLHDDFRYNSDSYFWEFINEEVDTAYYLGMYFDTWFYELKDFDKQYLYSIGARHANDEVEEHQKQLTFWSEKYVESHPEDTIDIIDMHEYVLNNIILQPEDEELIVNIAFTLGRIAHKIIFKDIKDEEDEIEFKAES